MNMGVTLHEIVRARFTHFAAAHLRIILREIIKYAVIMIRVPIAARDERGVINEPQASDNPAQLVRTPNEQQH
jgi:hypothetical protein